DGGPQVLTIPPGETCRSEVVLFAQVDEKKHPITPGKYTVEAIYKWNAPGHRSNKVTIEGTAKWAGRRTRDGCSLPSDSSTPPTLTSPQSKRTHPTRPRRPARGVARTRHASVVAQRQEVQGWAKAREECQGSP